MAIEMKPIMDELKLIRKELDEIRDKMPDKDMFLDAEETLLLEESFKNERKGNLISSEELNRELGI